MKKIFSTLCTLWLICVFQIDGKEELSVGKEYDTFYFFNLKLVEDQPYYIVCEQLFLFGVSKTWVEKDMYKKKKKGDLWGYQIEQGEIDLGEPSKQK